MTHSVWAKLGLKMLGLTLGMLALSGVGAWSLSGPARGVEVPLASMLGENLHVPWLAAESPSAMRASGGGTRASVNALAVGPTLAAATQAAGLAAASPGTPAATSAATSVSAASASASASAATRDEPASGARAQTAGISDDGKVILNLASAEELRHLPGIGPKRADAIIALRTRLGRFKQVNDLLRVKGIGVRGLRRLLPHLVLDPAKPSA